MTRAYLILTLSALLGACGEPGTEPADAKTYQKDGLRFEYPGNWRIVSDEADAANRRVVNIDGPDGEMFVIHVGPTIEMRRLNVRGPNWLRSYADVVSGEGAASSGPIKRSSTLRETTEGGQPVVIERTTITILGDSMPQTVVYRMRVFGDHTCFMTSKVVDAHAVRAAPGFDLIKRSLRLTT